MGILAKLLRRRSGARTFDSAADNLPRPRLGGPAETWLRRAEKSARALAEVRDARRGAGRRRRSDDPLVGMYDDVAVGATATVAELRRVAGEVTLVEQAIARIPSPALTERRARLAAEPPADTIRQGLAEIDDQLAVDLRLRASREELLCRMEAGAVALDGLVARAVEISTTGGGAPVPVPGDISGGVAELRDRLEAVRIGLAETEAATQRILRPDAPQDGT